MSLVKHAACLIVLLSGLSAATTSRADDQSWRMTFCNGHWWYWSPDNHWLVHDGQQWTPYNAENQPTTAYRYQSGYGGAEIAAPAVSTAVPTDSFSAPSGTSGRGYWGIGYWENSVGYAGYGWGGGGKW